MSKSTLAEIKKLHQKKFRDAKGLFLIEGWKSVLDAVDAGVEFVHVLIDVKRVPDKNLLKKIHSAAVAVYEVSAKDVESVSDTVNAQGIIAAARKFDSTGTIHSVVRLPAALIVVLDSINDPGNLGTIIRTCDWFGADALVVGKNSVDMYNPKVVRATMGSLFHLPIAAEVDVLGFIEQCRKENFKVYSTELGESDDIRTISFAQKSLMIIGNESHGVSKELSRIADTRVSIPKFGKAESLNAAMACGIILSRMRLS
jgi:TrmH family RNA methyltransferase